MSSCVLRSRCSLGPSLQQKSQGHTLPKVNQKIASKFGGPQISQPKALEIEKLKLVLVVVVTKPSAIVVADTCLQSDHYSRSIWRACRKLAWYRPRGSRVKNLGRYNCEGSLLLIGLKVGSSHEWRLRCHLVHPWALLERSISQISGKQRVNALRSFVG